MRSVLIRSVTGMILFFSFQDEDTGGGGVCRQMCVCVCVVPDGGNGIQHDGRWGMGSSMTEDGEWDPA